MKLLILFLLVSCNNSPDENKKLQYLSNGYLCNTIRYYSSGVELEDCEQIFTGEKVKNIINATNITQV